MPNATNPANPGPADALLTEIERQQNAAIDRIIAAVRGNEPNAIEEAKVLLELQVELEIAASKIRATRDT